jgi:putative addiction module component (TIGR02574 family)
MSQVSQQNIKDLSRAEKLLLVGDIWDELSNEPAALELTEAQKTELLKRYREYQENPAEGDSWEVVKQRLLAD